MIDEPTKLGRRTAHNQDREIVQRSRLRCSLLRPDPAQRGRLAEIRDNLLDRIAEAEKEGWLGEVEGLRVSLAGAEDKLAQVDRRRGKRPPVNLVIPALRV
ncbi:hypothetical protein [Streptomyces sp. CT34]|uniref:hypothetical protein n=1 Tax=Streptomyces sp. CT34 TaxID=1553907 RepID=UPI000B28909D|nr:hypothetical protein [Streptomyces sp. CT34]